MPVRRTRYASTDPGCHTLCQYRSWSHHTLCQYRTLRRKSIVCGTRYVSTAQRIANVRAAHAIRVSGQHSTKHVFDSG
eukprot:3003050-Rhodomonas_salina.1